MRHDSEVVGKIWNGSVAKKRNFLFALALILVLLIILVSYNNRMKTAGAVLDGEKTCQNPTAVLKIGGPVIDEFMDISEPCTSELQVDQASLSIQRSCSKDPINFFLLWSTKREDFKLKHFRAIDSIFRHHPNARLHIFTKDMSICDFAFYTDQSFDVVHHQLEPEKIFRDTPLDRWAQRISEWKQSSNYFSHVTDAMRLALLWKYGGVYLDTDAIVIRNLEKVRNALGVQHPSSVASGEINGAVLIFDKMHPFLYYAMHLLMSIYDPNNWDIAGPQVVTRSVAGWNSLHPYMVRWIPEHIAGELDLPNEPLGTPQLTVFTDRFAFYGLAWWQLPRVDTTENHPDVAAYKKNIEERAYAYHYVNQMVRNTGGKIKKGVYLFDLLQRACLYECSREDLDISITDMIAN